MAPYHSNPIHPAPAHILPDALVRGNGQAISTQARPQAPDVNRPAGFHSIPTQPILQGASASSSSLQQATAIVQELFSSLQGEGIYVGYRQLFVRFAHCHLHCTYCDTAMTSPDGRCHCYPLGSQGEPFSLDNPMTSDTLVSVIEHYLSQQRHHSVSFTGGEPLLYHRFLASVFQALHQQDIHTYLETSGTQADFLASVLPWTRTIAMDIKLPSTTGETPQWDNHRLFFQAAQDAAPHTTTFVKLVVNHTTSEAELEQVRSIVTDPTCPILIQPETELNSPHPVPPVRIATDQLQAMEQWFSQYYHHVRVIPQTHKMLRVQ